MNNQIFDYKGSKITFLTENGVMVNATDMARPFGESKAAKFWLGNLSTHEYLDSLSKVRNLTLTDLVEVKRGGANPGTWMHEDVALEFARWLSPEFAIWCNDRIKELINHGFTATPDKIEELLRDPDVLINALTQLKEERAEKERLAMQNQLQRDQLKASAPKLEYYNEVLQAENTHTITTIAKELGMGSVTLNKKLHQMGIQYRHNGSWVLYHRFQGQGFTKTKTTPFYNSKGEIQTSILTVWTEKGRQFIHEKVKN